MHILTPEDWEEFLKRNPQAHLLQTSRWGQLKSEFGWEAVQVRSGDAGAQVLFRSLPLGFSIAYIPRGPIGPGSPALLPVLDEVCRSRRAIVLKIEPDGWEDDGQNRPPEGFQHSTHSIQPPRTITIDLNGDEEVILSRMKQKTRYNIRLGQRKGVVVRESGDLETFTQLMATTGERDAFGVHSAAYYRRVYELFKPHEMCELLVAEFEGTPLAALMVFARGNRAWYFYGASSNEHRNFMPSYVLQWEALRWARRRGCIEYDFWGVPDENEDTLESEFSNRSDGLWGVYRFKRGFGGVLRRTQGPWDRVYNPAMYRLYQWWATR